MINFFDYYRAIRVSGLSQAEMLIALAYAESYNTSDLTREYPDSSKGIFRIAEETGYKHAYVSEIRASLIRKGWLGTKRRLGQSSLTSISMPVGFDYDLEKKRQDERVAALNEANNKRIGSIRKAKKPAEMPKKETVTKKATEVTQVPQMGVQGLVEASESHDNEAAFGTNQSWDAPKKAPVVEKPKNDTAKKTAQMLNEERAKRALLEKKKVDKEAQQAARDLKNIESILEMSLDTAMAIELFRDSTFAPHDNDVVRAAKARNEADYKANETQRANGKW